MTPVLLVAFLSFALCVLSFQPAGYRLRITRPSETQLHPKISTRQNINMLFDFFKPKKSATASHILVKGNNAVSVLTNLKTEIVKSKNIPETFAESARKLSACPSSKNGGALGTFKQGQMVPAFDKVVFSAAVGEVHGPVITPFGAHLIYIEDREA